MAKRNNISFLKFLFISLLFCVMFSHQAMAQLQNDKENFYRPVKSNDLFVKLPPRIDQDKLLDSDSSFFTDSERGCPDEILIGSISDDVDIFGDVDIEVFIGNDVFINCGR